MLHACERNHEIICRIKLFINFQVVQKWRITFEENTMDVKQTMKQTCLSKTAYYLLNFSNHESFERITILCQRQLKCENSDSHLIPGSVALLQCLFGLQ
jgi:hypothetical protein